MVFKADSNTLWCLSVTVIDQLSQVMLLDNVNLKILEWLENKAFTRISRLLQDFKGRCINDGHI